MFSLYNDYHTDQKLKQESDERLLITNLCVRQQIIEYKNVFTMKKLKECKTPFLIYLDQYGESEPVQTAYVMFNFIGNRALSYTHYIHTNQPYAKAVKDAIDAAIENKEKLPKCRAVFNALIEIKKIYDKMLYKRIAGTVKDSITAMFKKFNLDLQDKDIVEQMANIEKTLEGIKEEVQDNQRIRSRFD